MATRSVPDRVRWAVDLLDPQPDERLLEVGVGPGASAELVCGRLTDGVLLAADRSATAISRTASRCAEHVEAGRLVLLHGALDALELPDASLDTAFSVNVNLFWTTTADTELTLLRRVLRPGGRLAVLFGGGPPGHDVRDRVLRPIAESLTRNGFEAVRAVQGADGVGVLAIRPDRP